MAKTAVPVYNIGKHLHQSLTICKTYIPNRLCNTGLSLYDTLTA